MIDAETAMRQALEGKFYRMPGVNPWVPKREHPEHMHVVRRKVAMLSLPAPVHRRSADVPVLPRFEDVARHGEFILTLQDVVDDDYPGVCLGDVLSAVVAVTGLARVHILGKSRHIGIMRSRLIFYYVARRVTTRSLPQIGRYCGGRDHTTVISGCRRVERERRYFEPELSRVLARFDVKE